MIKFRCSNCSHGLGAPDNYAGKRVRCSKCHQPTRVPERSEEPAQKKHELIKYRCPNCNQKLGVSVDYAGKRVRCSKCKEPSVVPSPQAGPVPQEPVAAGGITDDMLEGPVGAGDMFGDKALTEQLLAAEASAPAAEGELRLKPASPGGEGEAQKLCPACGTANRLDTDFCTSCGEMIASRAEGGGIAVVTKIPLSLAASFGFTIGGAVAWAVLAYLIGFVWVQPLCILVAGLAGYGLVLFTDKRNAMLGLLAAAIGLVGIFCGKVFIAKWVVLPELETAFASADWGDVSLTEEDVDYRMADANAVFRAVCFQMAEEGEFEKEFASKVVDTHYDGRAPIGEVEQIQAGMKQVEGTIESWDQERKREAIKAQHERDMAAFRDFGKELVGVMTESTDEDEEVPEGFRQVAKEANELMSGDKALSETKIGFFMAFFGSFSCLDIFWFPLGLWGAYKIGSGRD